MVHDHNTKVMALLVKPQNGISHKEVLKVSKKRRRGVHMSKRQSFWLHVIELIRPSMGYRAFGRWIILKFRREADNPHKVALGAAVGMWVNFIPIPGIGAITAIVAAFVFRASIIAAFMGQLLGNPWTFPFIWWLNYLLGRAILGGRDNAIGFSQLMNNFNFSFIWDNWAILATSVVLPILVGGFIIGTILGILTYLLVLRELKQFNYYRHQKKLVERRERAKNLDEKADVA